MEHQHPIQFVSLGPGDPELITLKAYKALQEADLIFCPGTPSSHGGILSRSKQILLELDLKEEQISVFSLPMSKNREAAFNAYEKVHDEALQAYAKGLRVAIVAEGHAGFYASIHSIYETLSKENVSVEQIAGIPAFIAAGASCGLHIVQQEQRLVVVPGVTTVDELNGYLSAGMVVVIMKLSQCAQEVWSLLKIRPTDDYHYFENVGTANHFYTTNREELMNKKYPYFSLLIIQPQQ